MNILSAEKLTCIVGDDKTLFSDVTLGISKGDKFALVGLNGCGKSTLLKTLSGKRLPDKGIVGLRKGIRAGYLEQDPDFPKEIPILDAVLGIDNPASMAVKNYELALLHPDDHKRLDEAMSDMEHTQAWDLESKVKQILSAFGISNFEQTAGEMSGGQKKRAALAALLIDEPDLLLLDEPTNHLDLEMVEWLERYLINYAGSILMVTHDRYFLDRVANGIVELNEGKSFFYEGDYEYFLEKKSEREVMDNQSAEKARNLLRTELEWLRRQPKARTTKNKARIDASVGLKERAKGPELKQELKLEIGVNRVGNTIIEMKNVSFSFGEKNILNKFNYVYRKNEKLGIIGPNGTGKTTFLEIMTERTEAQKGQVKMGMNTVIGYYRQEGLVFTPNQKAIEVVTDVAEFFTLPSGDTMSASQFMNYFLFPPQLQFTPVEKLSGGEKKRLMLLRVLIKNPNFLVLDEPTNDLDLITLNALEDFLSRFNGCLVIVSHDRYFMDKLVDHLLIFEGDGVIREFNGNYSDYRRWKIAQEKEAEKKAQETLNSATDEEWKKRKETRNKKPTFAEQKEFATLTREIEQMELRKTEVENLLTAGSSNYLDLEAWGKELGELKNQLEIKSTRWLELSEVVE